MQALADLVYRDEDMSRLVLSGTDQFEAANLKVSSGASHGPQLVFPPLTRQA